MLNFIVKRIIINENSIKADTVFLKARAIIFNERNHIYICNMNDSYILPGGTVEDNELPIDTLKRELYEELGITNCNLEPLVEIDYYHYNFPKFKSDLYENRLNKVWYYCANVNSKDLGDANFTEYENQQNIIIEEYNIDELLQKVMITRKNKYSKFTNKELAIVLNYIQGIER